MTIEVSWPSMCLSVHWCMCACVCVRVCVCVCVIPNEACAVKKWEWRSHHHWTTVRQQSTIRNEYDWTWFTFCNCHWVVIFSEYFAHSMKFISCFGCYFFFPFIHVTSLDCALSNSNRQYWISNNSKYCLCISTTEFNEDSLTSWIKHTKSLAILLPHFIRTHFSIRCCCCCCRCWAKQWFDSNRRSISLLA